jgi:hypothetical protein
MSIFLRAKEPLVCPNYFACQGFTAKEDDLFELVQKFDRCLNEKKENSRYCSINFFNSLELYS